MSRDSALRRGSPKEAGDPRKASARTLVFAAGVGLSLFASGLGGCDHAPSPAPDAAPSAGAVTGPLIEWVRAPEGDLAEIVRFESERAKKDGRTLLVYVGASWCDPCQRFHAAAEAGEVKGNLPPLRMLELDADRDSERLAAAGYGSRMIPLFAVPGPDGRGTKARIEGSVKGAGAVGNIVPRLSALLVRGSGS